VAVVDMQAWAATVHAASPEPARDRARTYLTQRLVDGLNLPDDKALALRTIFRKADERRLELTAKRQALDKKLRTALARPDKDQAELTRLVAETNDVDRELAAVAEDSFAEAQNSLTVEQQAKLLLLRRELQGLAILSKGFTLAVRAKKLRQANRGRTRHDTQPRRNLLEGTQSPIAPPPLPPPVPHAAQIFSSPRRRGADILSVTRAHVRLSIP